MNVNNFHIVTGGSSRYIGTAASYQMERICDFFGVVYEKFSNKFALSSNHKYVSGV